MAQMIYCDECDDEEKTPAFLIISFAGTGQVDAVCLAHWPDYLYNQVVGMVGAGMTELTERVADAVIAASHVEPTAIEAEAEAGAEPAPVATFPMTENVVRSTHGHRKKAPPPADEPASDEGGEEAEAGEA